MKLFIKREVIVDNPLILLLKSSGQIGTYSLSSYCSYFLPFLMLFVSCHVFQYELCFLDGHCSYAANQREDSNKDIYPETLYSINEVIIKMDCVSITFSNSKN